MGALWSGSRAADGATGFSPQGGDRGARARVRCAFLLTLPMAFLALVPAGTVATWLYPTHARRLGAVPFRPALPAVDAALNGAQPGLGQTLVHLAILTVAYMALARVALARFH